jgi:hypothetical protein
MRLEPADDLDQRAKQNPDDAGRNHVESQIAGHEWGRDEDATGHDGQSH